MKRLILHILAIALISYQARAELAWNPVAPMQTPRMGHCAVASGGKIYVFGGVTIRRIEEIATSVEVYDPATNTWADAGRLPHGITQAAAVSVGKYVFLFGGLTSEGPSREIIRYDTETNRSEVRGRLPEPRLAMGVVKINRRILMIGGIKNRQEFTGDGYLWEPDSNRWEAAPVMNQPRSSFGLASNGNVWAVGGVYIGPSNRMEVLRDDTWTEVQRGNMPEPRGEMGMAFLNDTTLVVAGGMSRGDATNSVIAFNTNNNTWRRLPVMELERMSFPLVSLNGKLYAIGGGSHGNERMGGITTNVQVLEEMNAVAFDPLAPTTPALVRMPVWPNPSNGRFSFEIPQTSRQLRISDLSGRLVYSSRIIPTEIWSWDAGDLPANVYEIEALDDTGSPVSVGRAVLTK